MIGLRKLRLVSAHARGEERVTNPNESLPERLGQWLFISFDVAWLRHVNPSLSTIIE